MNTLTKTNIWNIFSSTPNTVLDKYADLLIRLTVENGIDTAKRQAMFLAQIKHESGGMKITEENLNYSASRLLQIFGKYFNRSTASQYARNPRAIASKVYANRMGNGSESSGEGWKYRGRGLIQLTGKDNYSSFSRDTGIDVVSNPDYLLTPEGAILSAIWFWNKNDLNSFADKSDIEGSTRRINGGYNGLHERKIFYADAVRELGKDNGIAPVTVDDIDKPETKTEVCEPENVQEPEITQVSEDTVVSVEYKKGSKGEMVRFIQEVVGTDVDGDFGPKTFKAVKAWQKANDLPVTGKIDQDQLNLMKV